MTHSHVCRMFHTLLHMRHTHVNAVSVISHTNMRCVASMNELCHAYEWVRSHLSCAISTDEWCHTHEAYTRECRKRHITHKNEMCGKYH